MAGFGIGMTYMPPGCVHSRTSIPSRKTCGYVDSFGSPTRRASGFRVSAECGDAQQLMPMYDYGHCPGVMFPGSSVQASPEKPLRICCRSETPRMY